MYLVSAPIAFLLCQTIECLAHLGAFIRRIDILYNYETVNVQRLALCFGEVRHPQTTQCLLGVHFNPPLTRD